ncbi:hypothetical protein WJX81_004204 [Elliptochloris bilobata]|uniref:Protein kinase domain-containing protein n=1 Tax=Elliptochloris bilobata TaxID=381761 RepID=A0AAW1QWH0_9CHLO
MPLTSPQATRREVLPVYPRYPAEYELMQEVGSGASAQVWLARCKPLDIQLAIKLLDLELHENNLMTAQAARRC